MMRTLSLRLCEKSCFVGGAAQPRDAFRRARCILKTDFATSFFEKRWPQYNSGAKVVNQIEEHVAKRTVRSA